MSFQVDGTKKYCTNCRGTHETEYELIPVNNRADTFVKRYRCTYCKRIVGTSGPISNVQQF